MVTPFGGIHYFVTRTPWPLVTALGFGSDLFFILTAYLITTLLLREREVHGKIDIGGFYLRRILRIWPLYFLCIGLIVALEHFQRADGIRSVHVTALLLFAGNWAFALVPVSSIATPLWSISVSEQFYLLWPWIMRRASRSAMFMFALSAVTAGVGYRAWLFHRNVAWEVVHFSSFSRLDAFAAGVVIALWLRGGLPSFRPVTRLALAATSILTGLFLLFLADPGPVHPTKSGPFYPLIVLCCAGLFLSVLGSEIAGAKTSFRYRALVYLGRISFGMYMWHALVISVLTGGNLSGWLATARLRQYHNGEMWSAMAALVVFYVATFVCACISYHFFEKPFLKIKNSRRAASLVPVTLPATSSQMAA